MRMGVDRFCRARIPPRLRLKTSQHHARIYFFKFAHRVSVAAYT